MRIRVLKFGGTSVDTHEHRLMAARKVIHCLEAGAKPVVVVSAIGRCGEPYATDTLVEFLTQLDPSVPPHPREKDLMMACGEIISTVIMAQTLRILGYPSVALTGNQAGIITDSEFGNARILEINPAPILRCLEQGWIPIVAGFQGVTRPDKIFHRGAITTLGRGGSDTTAAALGAALQAEAVEIYTDVDGVKTADPDFVPDAPTLREITYEEVAEIAHQGARVLHPRAAEIAMDYGIPLWVKCTFTDDPGTRVVAQLQDGWRRITGVTHTGKLVYLSFHIPYAEHKSLLELEIYRLMARIGVNLQGVGVDEEGLGIAFSREHWQRVRSALDGLLVPLEAFDSADRSDGSDRSGRMVGMPLFYLFQFGDQPSEVCQIQRGMLEKAGLGEKRLRPIHIYVAEGCTMVSLIAHGYGQEPGVFAKLYQTLLQEGIPVWQTADSELSLSCIIPESEVEKAVRILHERFELCTAT
ncbi:MAG: aspartate kinase [Fimbriimonadales bacterium]|nr:aspartate kinase [Fimbriimonadales bacterium]